MTGAGRSPFFAAYRGTSMSPLLREPAVLEVVPYDGRPVRVGDVVFFVAPSGDQPIVHRVVRVTLSGIATRGDNSTREDPYLLRQEDIRGRVAAVLRGGSRRQIAGGLRGRLHCGWLHVRRVTARWISRLLHPLYHALSRRANLAFLLPARIRPRVVVFRSNGQDLFRILLGHMVIGGYDEQKGEWRIRRPFRIFVNERLLSRHGEKHRPGVS